MLLYQNPAIEPINDLFLKREGVELLVLREDQNHPFIAGNKWWKLKHNLEQALTDSYQQILTFGGAWSNHIYATAAAAKEIGVESIGIIRGEETLPLNPILQFAVSQGMKLKYVSREEYRQKTDEQFLKNLASEFGRIYIIPEGGSNGLAVKGCVELGQKLSTYQFDYLCLPVGTGGTMAGLVTGLKGQRKIIGFPVLKGGEFLSEVIKQFLQNEEADYANWELATDYHFGGYAKTNPTLDNFISNFTVQHKIPLEPVYTGKMMYGIYDLIKLKKFESGSRILVLHTGGVH